MSGRRVRGAQARRQRRRRRLVSALVLLVAAFGGLGWFWPQTLLQAALRADTWWAGASTGSVQAAGQSWSVLRRGDFGSGRTVWVFVHGFTGSKENWLPLLRELPGDLPIVVPDLPGWGGSERQPGLDYGYAAQAERLAGFLSAEGLDDVVLVGHSMGGGIAAITAARYPQGLRGLVLISSAGIRFRDNAFGQAVLRGEHPFKVESRAELDAYLRQVFKHPPFLPWPLPQALVERRQADLAFELEVLQTIGRGSQAFAPAEAAADIGLPSLLLWCREDAVVDVSAADMYAALMPDSRTELLDDCGHMPMMERPAAVAAALLAWNEAQP